MSEDESALFLASMQGVKPLKASNAVTPVKSGLSTEGQRRHHDAQRRLALEKLSLELNDITPLEPYAVVSVKKQGVQGQVFKLFRQGKYEVQADLDLTGLSLIRARELLFDFVINSQASGLRNLIVIHGTGVNSQPIPAKLKSYVAAWLAEIEVVQGFHSAPPAWGGPGAMMVMLTKSEQDKLDTAEQHAKGTHRWA
ncbi:DNA endonuclease SmrA [Shewanella halotolerans]|uniref:DNA endonuclease SmrA n=1 Tax=Shewanella halotolerans TaxID=2864204 RepID=UPI001C65E9E4|nr:DNA endonuclease SmrA [Shewanella halotolerans]QYJ91760.1 DNA endonuclease SmrA [Shewanella halotolerans]